MFLLYFLFLPFFFFFSCDLISTKFFVFFFRGFLFGWVILCIFFVFLCVRGCFFCSKVCFCYVLVLYLVFFFVFSFLRADYAMVGKEGGSITVVLSCYA